MNTTNSDTIGTFARAQPGKGMLKLGLDVHGDTIVVAAMFDAQWKSPKSFNHVQFLDWVKKRRQAGWPIVSCYEAGPFGYGLHRQLLALGVTNHVIRPRNWDDQHRRIKTDQRDAMSILNALDRYLAGNREALSLVHAPSEDEEHRRSEGRMRQNLGREIQRLSQHGRGLALNYGFRLRGSWYGPRRWPVSQQQLPPWLLKLLEPWREAILLLKQQMLATTKKLVAATRLKEVPLGMGVLTAEEMDREVCDWGRFRNRRQVAGYTGLTPCESSSGSSRFQGPVSKCGNKRLRWMLNEAAWRLLRLQNDYRLVKKWRKRLLKEGQHRGRRKQIIVALARGFVVDWWRLRTGQTTPEKLGLKMRGVSAA